MKKTLYVYISKEIWPNFLACLLASVFIILATRMLSIMELIVSQGVGVIRVALMVLYLLPDIITFALPAASLMAVVLAFLRLSADSEIIAMKSSGISLYEMLPPVAAFAFLSLFFAFAVSILAVPWGNGGFRNLIFQIAQSKADMGVKERIFSEPFDNVVFYVNSFSKKTRVMKGVFVVDRRDPSVTNTIVAREARIFLRPQKKTITLHFTAGTVFVVGKDMKSERTISFNTYDLNIGLKDIMAALASREKEPMEMTIGELVSQLNRLPKGRLRFNETLIDLLERFSIPLAVFFMALIGVPLGAQMRARGRSAGIGVSLVIFLLYYLCLAGARSLGETGAVSPAIGVWIPDLFLLLLGIYLLRHVSKERPLNLLPRFLFRPQGN